jgi:site-specific recombinase XerD
MNNCISFSQAVEGFVLSLNARHLSQHTINDYLNTYRKFQRYLDEDPPIAEIALDQVQSFLAAQTVSKKTILNYHTGLSSMWTWALNEGLVKEHIIRKIPRPKPEKKAISPYAEADIRSMLSALTHSRSYTRRGKRESNHRLIHADRNRAIILLLLDTGMRATELCELCINHVDLKNRSVKVFGKGDKERILPISARTSQALWKYLASRPNERVNAPLFITKNGTEIDRDRLLKSLRSVGKRAGVKGANVHRFRHTFAINYLRNGGDPWSLQLMMGHSSLETVKIYLALAQADLEKTHKIASPVDNWRL